MGEKDIRAAFDKALATKPDPAIKGMLNEAASQQYKDRRHQWAVKLGGRFEHAGMSWFHLTVGIPNMSARDIKKQWKEELLPQLSSIEENERPEIISRLAKGLLLSEDPRSDGQRVLSTRSYLSQNMEKFVRRFNSKRFSPASKVFFRVVAQLSEYSSDELNLFGDFLKENGRLPDKDVKLEQAIPAVAEWLIQSRTLS